MAPGANWKGFLRLSLVTCPVALYLPQRTSVSPILSLQANGPVATGSVRHARAARRQTRSASPPNGGRAAKRPHVGIARQ
jgi:hypothetical protein